MTHDVKVWLLYWFQNKGPRREERLEREPDMENKIFCQSCGMPMEDAALYGTEKDGSKTADYCTYCYQEGAFTSDVTLEGMIEECLPHMVESGMAEAEARGMMEQFLPTLKRWAAR